MFDTARLLAILLAIITFTPIAVRGEDDALFREQIEPLLERRCYSCHSHASGTMEGGLALDWRSGWELGGDRGPAIVPGNAAASLVSQAVHRIDVAMPPDDPLSVEEVQLIDRWIAEGAHDSRRLVPPSASSDPTQADWWSLQPLVFPEVPAASGEARNPIDAFVQQSLATRNLSPAPLADRRTIIERLTVDLHGLLPTFEEIEAFESDGSADAIDRLVDRLLASPRYGERWARHWLDTVHFADTHGFEHDIFRPHAWRYRDYVVGSLSDGKPWSQFVSEQLAVDALQPQPNALWAALGFLGAGPFDLSTFSTAPVTFDYLDRDDLVAQTMFAFASTTANCARCHAHKFDPISQADYYSLQAVFSGIGKGDVFFDTDPQVAQRRNYWKSISLASAEKNADRLLAEDVQAWVVQWEQAQVVNPVLWSPLQITTFVSQQGSELQRLRDQSILAAGPRPETDTYVISGTTELSKVAALKLEVLTDPSLPINGPGRQDNGNLHLSEISVQLFSPNTKLAESLSISSVSSDFDQNDWGIALAIDGNERTAWGIHPQVGKDHAAVFVLTNPVQIDPRSQWLVTLKQLHGQRHLIGRFRISVTDSVASHPTVLPEEVSDALAVPATQRTSAQWLVVSAHVAGQRARSELEKLPPQDAVFGGAASYSVVNGGAPDVRFQEVPKPVHILQRGDFDKPLSEVQPGSLSVVETAAGIPARFSSDRALTGAERRLHLARWVIHPQNPLPWRSIVNRIWHFHFGRGIVDTPNDFGRMGGLPDHPQLLDYLAVRFRDWGGEWKPLHRMICTSRTYLQQSDRTTGSTAVDADNRLLSSRNSQRLDAETFRDSMLRFSGLLNDQMGGPGVENFVSSPGPQLTPKLDYLAYDWTAAPANRRSIYRVVWRGIPDPLMEALDFPDLGLLAPLRGQSTSPLQSLATLNHNLVLHCSEQAAANSTVTELFTRILARHPQAAELQQCESYAEIYGMAALARVLFNSNEFHFVD